MMSYMALSFPRPFNYRKLGEIPLIDLKTLIFDTWNYRIGEETFI